MYLHPLKKIETLHLVTTSIRIHKNYLSLHPQPSSDYPQFRLFSSAVIQDLDYPESWTDTRKPSYVKKLVNRTFTGIHLIK